MTRSSNKGYGHGTPPHKQTSSTTAAHVAKGKNKAPTQQSKGPTQRTKGHRNRVPGLLKHVPIERFLQWGKSGIAGHCDPPILSAQLRESPAVPPPVTQELPAASSASPVISVGQLPAESPREELYALTGLAPNHHHVPALNNQCQSTYIQPSIYPASPLDPHYASPSPSPSAEYSFNDGQCTRPSTESPGMYSDAPLTPTDEVTWMPRLCTFTPYGLLPVPMSNLVSGTSQQLQDTDPTVYPEVHATVPTGHRNSMAEIPLGRSPLFPECVPLSFPHHCTPEPFVPDYDDAGIYGQSRTGLHDVASNTLGLDYSHDEVAGTSQLLAMVQGDVGSPVATGNVSYIYGGDLRYRHEASSVGSSPSWGMWPSLGLRDAPPVPTHEPLYLAGGIARTSPVSSSQPITHPNEFVAGLHDIGGDVGFDQSAHLTAYFGQGAMQGTPGPEGVVYNSGGIYSRTADTNIIVPPSPSYEPDLPLQTQMGLQTKPDADDYDRLAAWLQYVRELSPDTSHLVHAATGGYPTSGWGPSRVPFRF
ncbi:hypothetical protein K466DRAFT_664252 [Polyporus arcularius HHB13444]|uniref:Uncharacterized protein n=1 Tax=Polyporus arcularius HHB13444 TaxID=1314778 RepID=A0A5C3P800_9APHY|nr:hypothetical protein K466DRAFT_664252 [Polyporus arcularius HHB13444]